MKRIITLLIAAAMMTIGTNVSAQMSISAGYANSRTTFDIASFYKMHTNLNGVYAGLSYNIPLSAVGTGSLGIAPGLYASYLMKKDAGLAVVRGDLSESYLSVPFNFNLTFPVADGVKALAYAGPTFQCGLSSKVTVTGVTSVGETLGISGVSGDNDMYDGTISQYLGYQRCDVLLGGGIGLEFEDMIRLTIGYDAGLLNRGGSAIAIHRNQFSIGLSYLF